MSWRDLRLILRCTDKTTGRTLGHPIVQLEPDRVPPSNRFFEKFLVHKDEKREALRVSVLSKCCWLHLTDKPGHTFCSFCSFYTTTRARVEGNSKKSYLLSLFSKIGLIQRWTLSWPCENVHLQSLHRRQTEKLGFHGRDRDLLPNNHDKATFSPLLCHPRWDQSCKGCESATSLVQRG